VVSDLIRIRSADLGYSRRATLRGVDLTIRTGQFIGIVGPNGAGKTTLLKAILGLLPALSGAVERGAEVTIGYVPQRDTMELLYPLTVTDIVLMGRYGSLGAVRRPGRSEVKAARAALEDAGIVGLADRRYAGLSGGQKQRVLIARALISQPLLLILDEPTNGMDLPAEKAMMDLVRHLHDEHRMTVLMVSHLLNTVLNYADTIALVGDGAVRVGPISEMITEEGLTDLYGIPIRIARLEERIIALAARETAASEVDDTRTGGARQ